MNANKEKLVNVEKKNNRKFILKIVGMASYWLVFLVCFITLLCAVLVPKSDNEDNVEESSATVAYADVVDEYIYSVADIYYIYINPNTIIYSTKDYTSTTSSLINMTVNFYGYIGSNKYLLGYYNINLNYNWTNNYSKVANCVDVEWDSELQAFVTKDDIYLLEFIPQGIFGTFKSKFEKYSITDHSTNLTFDYSTDDGVFSVYGDYFYDLNFPFSDWVGCAYFSNLVETEIYDKFCSGIWTIDEPYRCVLFNDYYNSDDCTSNYIDYRDILIPNGYNVKPIVDIIESVSNFGINQRLVFNFSCGDYFDIYYGYYLIYFPFDLDIKLYYYDDIDYINKPLALTALGGGYYSFVFDIVPTDEYTWLEGFKVDISGDLSVLSNSDNVLTIGKVPIDNVLYKGFGIDNYTKGFDEGYDTGYDEGEIAGYDTGYTNGYNVGVSASEEDIREAYNQGTDGVITTDYGFDTLYWNTAKSNQYVDSVLSQLTYKTDGSNNAHYYVYVSAVIGNFLDIVKNTTNNTYSIYLASSNTGHNRVDLYNSSVGWLVDNPRVKSSSLAVDVTDLLSTYEVPSVGTFTVGEQNNLLVDLFSTVPFYNSDELITFGDVRYSSGYDSGYSVGESAGYDTGYDNGYGVGLTDQITLNPISTFLEPIQAFLGTPLFGSMSIGGMLTVALFVMLALIFLRMFAGG